LSGSSAMIDVSIAVVEYVADAVSMLTLLSQRLGHGGTLLITVPNRVSPVRIAQRIARPLLRRSRATTGRLADQSFLELRPHDDYVPWQHATKVAGLVVKEKRTVPLGLSGVRRWFHPTLLISLERPQASHGKEHFRTRNTRGTVHSPQVPASPVRGMRGRDTQRGANHEAAPDLAERPVANVGSEQPAIKTTRWPVTRTHDPHLHPSLLLRLDSPSK
jgi:hypothetical protein